jgi:hypothetical protein
MHDNGTLLLVGIQCIGVTDLAIKALDEEELMTAVSRTGQEAAEGISSSESELTSVQIGMFRFPELAQENLLTLEKRVTAMVSNFLFHVLSILSSTLLCSYE